MRLIIAAVLFAAVCGIGLEAEVVGQQPTQKKAAQNYDPPKPTRPDEGALKQIAEKTEKLRQAVGELRKKSVSADVLAEVALYLKAVENIVRFDEWYGEGSAKWATQTLDQGLARAHQAEGGEAPWRESPGKWVVRAYESKVDRSIQPYAVLLPHEYGKDPKKKWRLDVVLHGRDSTITEAKFISGHGTTAKAAAKDLDHVQLEIYGRGNNAYRWAGEADVFEAVDNFIASEENRHRGITIDLERVVLRGFSMGGAGSWHLGLHHPFPFAVIGPGAGFTVTHGYVGKMPAELPDYQEKCLRIYDAVRYAENAFNVPVVAYSGSKDAQKAAADNIEKALEGFKEPLQFTRLIAPGLEHQMPKEWQDKAEAEYRKHLAARPTFSNKGRTAPERVRFVTYTTRFNFFGHGFIRALEHQYEKAVVDSRWTKEQMTITTENIAALELMDESLRLPPVVVIDGQKLDVKAGGGLLKLERSAGKWAVVNGKPNNPATALRKVGGESHWLQGPIDDAFTTAFRVVEPSSEGWHPAASAYESASLDRFIREWDRYFRGKIELGKIQPARAAEAEKLASSGDENLVLFGDPESNPLIAKVLPKLPITWTKEKLVVNGVEYDPRTHVPVLIYPNPLNPDRYIVINSGHTFHEADFKGTNALLYPRLGDWAVLKPTPTAKDPAAAEVVAAGLFDEHWQFAK